MRTTIYAGAMALLLAACASTAHAPRDAPTGPSVLPDYDPTTRTYKPRTDAQLYAGTGGAPRSEEPEPDAQPSVRVPPVGFERCIPDGPSTEVVGLRFDVSATGEVVNVRVTDSTDPCYDRYALRSAGRWRYEPKLVDGRPAVRRGVQTRLTFETHR